MLRLTVRAAGSEYSLMLYSYYRHLETDDLRNRLDVYDSKRMHLYDCQRPDHMHFMSFSRLLAFHPGPNYTL